MISNGHKGAALLFLKECVGLFMAINAQFQSFSVKIYTYT